MKDKDGDPLAVFHNILNRCEEYLSQLLIVQTASDVRQIETHTAEPLISDPSPLEVEIGIVYLKSYKSSGSDQIPLEVIEAGGKTLRFGSIIH